MSGFLKRWWRGESTGSAGGDLAGTRIFQIHQ